MVLPRIQDVNGIVHTIGVPSVNVQQGPGLTEGAQLGRTIQAVAGNISGTMFQELGERAAIKGYQAGLDDAVQFDENGKLLPATTLSHDNTIYGRNYNAGVRTLYTKAAVDDARQHAVDLGNKYPDDPEAFRRDYNTWTKTTLEKMHPDLASVVENEFVTIGNTGFGTLADNKAKRDLASALEFRQQKIESIIATGKSRVAAIGPDRPRAIAEMATYMAEISMHANLAREQAPQFISEADVANIEREAQVSMISTILENEGWQRASAQIWNDDQLRTPVEKADAFANDLRENWPEVFSMANQGEREQIIENIKRHARSKAAERVQQENNAGIGMRKALLDKINSVGERLNNALLAPDAMVQIVNIAQEIKGGIFGNTTSGMSTRNSFLEAIRGITSADIADRGQADFTEVVAQLQARFDFAVAGDDEAEQQKVIEEMAAIKKSPGVNAVDIARAKNSLLAKAVTAALSVAQNQVNLEDAYQIRALGGTLNQDQRDAIGNHELQIAGQSRNTPGGIIPGNIDAFNPLSANFDIGKVNEMGGMTTSQFNTMQAALTKMTDISGGAPSAADSDQIVNASRNLMQLKADGNDQVQEQLSGLSFPKQTLEMATSIALNTQGQPRDQHPGIISKARDIWGRAVSANTQAVMEAVRNNPAMVDSVLAQTWNQSLREGNPWEKILRDWDRPGATETNIFASLKPYLNEGIVELMPRLFMPDTPDRDTDMPEAAALTAGDSTPILPVTFSNDASSMINMARASPTLGPWLDNMVIETAIEQGMDVTQLANPLANKAFLQALGVKLHKAGAGVSVLIDNKGTRAFMLPSPEKVTGLPPDAIIDAGVAVAMQSQEVAELLDLTGDALESRLRYGDGDTPGETSISFEVDEKNHVRGVVGLRIWVHGAMGQKIDITRDLYDSGRVWVPEPPADSDYTRRLEFHEAAKALSPEFHVDDWFKHTPGKNDRLTRTEARLNVLRAKLRDFFRPSGSPRPNYPPVP